MDEGPNGRINCWSGPGLDTDLITSLDPQTYATNGDHRRDKRMCSTGRSNKGRQNRFLVESCGQCPEPSSDAFGRRFNRRIRAHSCVYYNIRLCMYANACTRFDPFRRENDKTLLGVSSCRSGWTQTQASERYLIADYTNILTTRVCGHSIA